MTAGLTPPGDDLRRVCVVGGSMAGQHAARSLRQHGYRGEIVLVGAEDHPPYDRTPISKQLLTGEWSPDRTMLLGPDEAARLDIDMRLGVAATALDTDNREVHLADSSVLPYDGLVVATGATPRQLPGQPDAAGVTTLRTLDDASRLRTALAPGVRVAIVGAGFIGLEAAAACRTHQAAVTVVEPLPGPLGGSFGPELDNACISLHVKHGVEFRFGQMVAAIEHDAGRVTGVRLGSGHLLAADVVVVGVGVRPEVGWLEGSGLELDDGVVCDSRCFAAPRVVAAGDVARWAHPRLGHAVRVEHWTNAAEQGKAAAVNLVAGSTGARDYEALPYFWSDQYDRRVQFAGTTSPEAQRFSRSYGTGFVTAYARGGRFEAVLGFGEPGPFMRLRRLLAQGADLGTVRALVEA